MACDYWVLDVVKPSQEFLEFNIGKDKGCDYAYFLVDVIIPSFRIDFEYY